MRLKSRFCSGFSLSSFGLLAGIFNRGMGSVEDGARASTAPTASGGARTAVGAAASSSQRTRALGPLVTWKQLGATRDAGGFEEREIEREGQNFFFFAF